MKHTVIVSSYNRPTMLRQALASVFASDYDGLEVIVADDGSVDEVKEVKNHFDVKWIDFSDDKRDRVFRYSIGINRALDIAKGNIIHYLADDDLFAKDRFDFVDAEMGNAVVCFGRLIYFNDKIYWKQGGGRFPLQDISPNNPHPIGGGVLDHNQVFHRRDCDVKKWRVMNNPTDCVFFHDLSKIYKFHKFNKIVAAKRDHKFNLIKLRTQGGGLKE